MDTPPNRASSAAPGSRAERRAMIALLAAFALLVQALVATPVMAMAMAAPLKAHGPLGEAATICTSHGLQILAPGDMGGGPAGSDPEGDCDHCVCPPAAALTARQPAHAAPRVAYAAPEPLGPREQAPPPARAPPRPPGQGPPATNA